MARPARIGLQKRLQGGRRHSSPRGRSPGLRGSCRCQIGPARSACEPHRSVDLRPIAPCRSFPPGPFRARSPAICSVLCLPSWAAAKQNWQRNSVSNDGQNIAIGSRLDRGVNSEGAASSGGYRLYARFQVVAGPKLAAAQRPKSRRLGRAGSHALKPDPGDLGWRPAYPSPPWREAADPPAAAPVVDASALGWRQLHR